MMSTKERLFEYDFIRAVSIIFVVAVHSLVVIDFSDKASLFYFMIMQVVFFTSNGMFFMMSGKFALSGHSWKGYYVRKINSILIPMIVFFTIRTIYAYEGQFVKSLFHNFMGGLSNTEYWFLYTLIGNLLLAPILAKAFQVLSEKEHTIFVGLTLLYHTLLWASTILGIPFAYSFIFSGWSFYFYLGYSIEKIVTNKKRFFIVCISGVIALVAITVMKYKGITTFVHDLSPLFTIVTVATFFLLIKCSSFVPQNCRKIIHFIAKHSFSVFLCHMMVLETITSKLSINVLGPKSIGFHILITIIVFVFSIVVSFIAETFIIKPLQTLSDKLINSIKKNSPEKAS